MTDPISEASVQAVPQRLPDAVPDSLAESIQEADSAATDSLQALAEIMEDLSEGVTETGQMLATGQWQDIGAEFFNGLVDLLVDFVPKLLSALFVLLILYLVLRFTRNVIAKLLKRTKFIDAGLGGLISKTFSVVAWVFIGIMVLAQFNVNVSALLAGLSVVGIAVGLAAQDTLQNFIAGITILIDRPFRVGHYIDIDGTYGKIEEITLRSTRMRTIKNEMMVMPNSQMINRKVINHTQMGSLRVDVAFGIAYKEYPLEARKVVLALVKGDDRIDKNREPDVVVTALNNSSVDMALRFHIRDASLAIPLRWEYTEKIREALREADIEIPFPHLQLFVDEARGLEQLPVFSEGGRAGGPSQEQEG